MALTRRIPGKGAKGERCFRTATFKAVERRCALKVIPPPQVASDLMAVCMSPYIAINSVLDNMVKLKGGSWKGLSR
jgi:hypothetical protein